MQKVVSIEVMEKSLSYALLSPDFPCMDGVGFFDSINVL